MFDELNASSIAAFGEPVIAGSATIQGIFDGPTVEGGIRRPGVGAETGADYTQPQIAILEQDAGKVPENSPVTVRGKSYRIAKHLPDGQGLIVVLLAEAGATPAPGAVWK